MALTVATQLQADRLRRDTDTNTTSLTDAEIDAYYTEAAEVYTTAGAAREAQTRIIVLQAFLASSAKRATYRQNQSSENVSDIFKQIKSLLEFWEGRLETAIRLSGSGAARFGRPGNIPQRVKEYPNA